MQKVIVLYNLKPGVQLEDYMEFSRAIDQVITPFQPGVIRFEVYAVKGSDRPETPYQIMEDIEVESWEAWQATLNGAGMKKVLEEWEKYGDGSSVVTLFGDKVK